MWSMPSGFKSYLMSLILLSSISSKYVTLFLDAPFLRYQLHGSYSLCHEKVLGLRESKMTEHCVEMFSCSC